MDKKTTGKGNVSNMAAGIGIGLGIGLILTLIGAVILASALTGETMAVEVLGYGVIVVQFIAAFLSSIVAMWCIKSRKMQVSLITAGAYLLTLMALNALFFGGEYAEVGATVLVVAMAGTVAAFIGSSGGKTGKRRHKIRIHG